MMPQQRASRKNGPRRTRGVRLLGEPHVFGVAPGTHRAWLAPYGLDVVELVEGAGELHAYLERARGPVPAWREEITHALVRCRVR